MALREKHRARPGFSFDASYVSVLHTWLACLAFCTAFFFGCLLHYKRIVKNGIAGYPDEWFPSVSATIGDWYPERSLFQIFIALTSGPRIALVSLQYYVSRSSSSHLPTIVFVSGIIRTLSCGGWVYVTSNDDHDVHDILMLSYIISNIPWMIGGILCTPRILEAARRKRCYIAAAFFGSIIPMIWFFVEHKVYEIPGAYTRYSFFEWALIFLDVFFDSVSAADFKEAGLRIAVGASFDVTASSTQVADSNLPKSTAVSPSASMESSIPYQRPPQASPQLSKSWSSMRIPMEWRPLASFLCDVYFAYMFWSIITSLIPTLFYFSVWELGISGHELALLSTLSPILLTLSPVSKRVRTRKGRSMLHFLSVLGLAAYGLRNPLHRLFVVAFATACVVLRQAVDWANIDDSRVGYHGTLMGLGLVLSSLSKHANHSNNPIWPLVNGKSGGYNKTGLVLALFALCEFSTRPISLLDPDVYVIKRKSPKRSPFAETTAEWLIPSVALGGLIFTLHSLLSDPGTLIAWSWTGYRNGRANGPMAHIHGSCTILAQSVGISIPVILASTSPAGISLTESPLWFIYGAANTFIMYKYRDWYGYAGGLQASVFFMSVIPLVLHRVSQVENFGRSYFTAWVVYCILSLGSVWTVAYAFVPGGVYLRERTDLILAAQIMLLAGVFAWPRSNAPPASFRLPRSMTSRILAFLASLSIMSVFVTLYRLPRAYPRPFKSGPRIVTAGIWTLHFGLDNEGRDSQRLVKTVIEDMQLDIVGLLETDLHRIVFGNRDLTRVLIEEMGYYVDLGPGPNSHTWGAALLSKFPIINSTHHLLPSPRGELAPAIEATLDVYGTTVKVVIAHNGQEEDPMDRELQSEALARMMAASYPDPVIFLGYVVTRPLEARPAPYDILITGGRMHDIDDSDWDRWCEYILYRGLYRTAYARVSRGTVTDTELQIGQFVLPRYGHGVTNDTREARYLRSWKEVLVKDHWLPMEYYGSEEWAGVNGHYYHVFNTPLYYRIPEGAVL